jgi:hypothetical protein
MNEQQKNPDLVKELIIINNDRYEGYQTAAKGTKETNLKELFDEYSRAMILPGSYDALCLQEKISPGLTRQR